MLCQKGIGKVSVAGTHVSISSLSFTAKYKHAMDCVQAAAKDLTADFMAKNPASTRPVYSVVYDDLNRAHKNAPLLVTQALGRTKTWVNQRLLSVTITLSSGLFASMHPELQERQAGSFHIAISQVRGERLIVLAADRRFKFHDAGDMTLREAKAFLVRRSSIDNYPLSTTDQEIILDQVGTRPVDLALLWLSVKRGKPPQGAHIMFIALSAHFVVVC
jgi:hypothetical protein